MSKTTAWFVNEDGGVYLYDIDRQQADFPNDPPTPYTSERAAEEAADLMTTPTVRSPFKTYTNDGSNDNEINVLLGALAGNGETIKGYLRRMTAEARRDLRDSCRDIIEDIAEIERERGTL